MVSVAGWKAAELYCFYFVPWFFRCNHSEDLKLRFFRSELGTYLYKVAPKHEIQLINTSSRTKWSFWIPFEKNGTGMALTITIMLGIFTPIARANRIQFFLGYVLPPSNSWPILDDIWLVHATHKDFMSDISRRAIITIIIDSIGNLDACRGNTISTKLTCRETTSTITTITATPRFILDLIRRSTTG